MQLNAITNRHLLSANALGAPSFAPALREGWDSHKPDHRAALVSLASQWAARGINYVQIREKDLAPDELCGLTEEIVAAVRKENQTTKVLLNGPARVALEANADGVHLPGSAATSAASEARELFARSGREAILSYACHSVKDVLRVREESQQNPLAAAANTLILYAPVFEKITPEGRLPGLGLESLRAAVHAANTIPVFALGGATNENAPACINAGAAGVAGIRLFLEMSWHPPM